jgi:hypothetical protein
VDYLRHPRRLSSTLVPAASRLVELFRRPGLTRKLQFDFNFNFEFEYKL